MVKQTVAAVMEMFAARFDTAEKSASELFQFERFLIFS
jgi:hypothetical protein